MDEMQLMNGLKTDKNSKTLLGSIKGNLKALAAIGVVLIGCLRLRLFSPAVKKTTEISVEPHRPLKYESVPMIRVRLTHTSMASANVSTTGPWRVLIDGREMARGKKTDAPVSAGCLPAAGGTSA